MTIKTGVQPRFIVDYETERNVAWPEGSRVYCKDSQKMYVLIGGTFINPAGSGSTPGAGLFELDPNGDLMPADSGTFTELVELDPNGDIEPKE